MLETKVVQVANNPDILNRTNEIWGSFGWNVSNVQVTHSQNTKTYTSGFGHWTGDSTVETTTINYATVTYQREKNMENYERVVELENEYAAMETFINQVSKKRGRPSLLAIIFMIIIYPVGILYLAYRIAMMVYYLVNIPKIKKNRERQKAILAEVSSLT
ncbi:MAG: hypothetical protein IJN79_02535 [Clostridia bacterium]|nr:hypothetical protein [Clostridia bacterium]MBQ7051660.1 hypothetical protein [Clostridia bacterium]